MYEIGKRNENPQNTNKALALALALASNLQSLVNSIKYTLLSVSLNVK